MSTTTTTEQLPVVLDGWAFQWIVWACLLVPALVIAGFTLLLASPWAIVLAAIGGGLVAYGALRARNVSVTVGPDAVRVANLLQTYEVAWPEIEHIELSRGSSLEDGVSRGVTFALRDGERILCQASTGYVPWAKHVLEALRPHAARWGIPITGPS